MDSCCVVIVEESNNQSLEPQLYVLKSGVNDHPNVLVVRKNGTLLRNAYEHEQNDLFGGWLGLFTLSANALLFEPFADGMSLTGSSKDGWGFVQLEKSLPHSRQQIMLRGGDVLNTRERYFKVGTRSIGNQESITAANSQVQVGSSMPEHDEEGINIQDTRAMHDYGTPRTVNPVVLGVIGDTPAKTRSDARQEGSPVSRLQMHGDLLFGENVDEIESKGFADDFSTTQIKDESQFEPEPHRENSVDLDSQYENGSAARRDALPSDDMFEEHPVPLETVNHTATAEVPDSVPPEQAVNNHTSPPESSTSRVISSRFNEVKEPERIVIDSLQDNEEEIETASETEEEEATEVADVPADSPELESSKRAPPGVIVVIPTRASKRKADENDASPPEAKRAKSGRKKSITPAPTPKTKIALPKTPSIKASKPSTGAKKTTKATARTGSPEDTVPPFVGEAPVVVFSNSAIPGKPQLDKFVRNHCKPLDKDTTSFDVLVVGRGQLKKTSKLLQAFAIGASIVTDEWVVKSSKIGHLLRLDHFAPTDRAHEKEWGIELAEAMGRDRSALFAGKTLFVTPALKKEYGKAYSDIEELATLVGVEEVMSKPARSFKPGPDMIVLGLEEGDADVERLLEQAKCYSKDFLSISIIRGAIDLNSDEFQLSSRGSQASKVSPSGSGRSRRATSTASSNIALKGEKTTTSPVVEPAKKRGRPRKSK